LVSQTDKQTYTHTHPHSRPIAVQIMLYGYLKVVRNWW